jgi:hypothetical protein
MRATPLSRGELPAHPAPPAPRPHPGVYLALGAYALLVALAIGRHEPWVDEAQSWLLARDASLAQLWGRLLHYEGTPGNWQTLLHALIRLGLPYPAYGYVSGFLALAAVYLLMRYAPLPLFGRILLPFTYYFCYQYAVIARSYAAIAPLLFAIAAIYPQARRRPVWISALLALLAGVSAHGFLLSACIWVTLCGPLLSQPGQFPASERTKHALAGLAYWCVLAFYALCAWPAQDGAFAAHRGLANLHFLPGVASAGLAGAFTGNWIASLGLIALSIPFLWRGGGWLFFALTAVGLCLFGTIVYTQLWHFGILFLAWIFAIWISAYKTRITAPTVLALAAAIAFQCYWTALAIRYDWSHAYSGSLAAARYLKQAFGRDGPAPGGIYAIGFPATAIQPYFPSNIYSNFGDAPAAHDGPAFQNTQAAARREGPDTGESAAGAVRRAGHFPAYWDWSQRDTANDPAALVASGHRELVLVGYKNVLEKRQWADLLYLLGYALTQHFDGGTFWQTKVFEFESYDLYRKTSHPRAASIVNMADVNQSAQLLDGVYAIEGGKSRWTAGNFSILLKTPPDSDRSGAELTLKFYLPEVQLRSLGPIAMNANVGGFELPAHTYSAPGEYTYSALVPPDKLQSGFAVIQFRLDKWSVGLNGDARELGVVATGAGLAPPSPAQ